MQETQVVIVGAGPIGLELAVSLQAMQVDYVHFEAGQIAQTITWYPKQARFFSGPSRIAVAGLPLTTVDQSKATREEYLAYLRGVVQHFGLDVRTYHKVTDIQRSPEGEGFVVRYQCNAEAQQTIACKYVVLAIGDMHHPRMLHVPGEDMAHVSHYFEEPHRYFQQKLLIIGGKNSAVEAALRCHHAGAQVSISYRQATFDPGSVKYWLLPEITSLIKYGYIKFYPCTQVQRIQHNAVTLVPGEAADAKQVEVPARQDVATDFVLALTGYEMDSRLFRSVGAKLEGPNDAPVVDPKTMQTTVPGLFVAGTVAAGTQKKFRLFIENCHPHVRQIVRAITGKEPPNHLVNDAAKRYALPES